MTRLKGVAMGAGYFSRFQYEAWSRIPDVRITAIYNRTEEKARAMMAQHGIAQYYAD
jgi:predicted dehydrogenase